MGISMDPYATVQTIERNTYDLQEDLYVRIVGPYDIETLFTLEVATAGGVRGDVQASRPGSRSFRTVPASDSFSSRF